MTPDLPAEKLCGVLHEIGYRHVEWTIGYPHAVWDKNSQWHIRLDDLDAEIARFQALSRDYALKVIGLGSAASIHDTQLLPQIFHAAAALDCPQVRLWASAYDGTRPYLDLLYEARSALEEVEHLGEQNGVKTVLEIHNGSILPSASAAYRLVESFDPEFVGVIFDPGNMIREGLENWQMGLEILGPYLAHVHVKNCGWFRDEQGVWNTQPTALEAGIIQYPQVLAALRSAGYDGYLSLEDFRGGYGRAPVGITSEQKLREDYRVMARLLAAD
jgi:sugar phosphate isomerase/epimerase